VHFDAPGSVDADPLHMTLPIASTPSAIAVASAARIRPMLPMVEVYQDAADYGCWYVAYHHPLPPKFIVPICPYPASDR
jgi:hypothetical protein